MSLILVEIIFSVLVVLTNVRTDDIILHKDFINLTQYLKFIYKMQPLVVIDHRGDKFLLPQNELNEKFNFKPKKKDVVVLYCPGVNNLLSMSNNDRHDCTKPFPKNRWTKFRRYDRFPKTELEENARCLSPNYSEIHSKNEACANNKGLLLKSGFIVGEFIELYTICFDKKINMMPLYTKHKLRGTTHLFPENFSELSEYPIRYLGKRIMKLQYVASPYYPANQIYLFRNTFKPITSSWYIKNAKDEKGRILIATPLTPPGDFYYTAVKTATLIFENTVPIFSSIYHGNLYRIEILGRRLALQQPGNHSLDVITGTFGILMLPDNMEQKIIYMNTEKNQNGGEQKYRPVPKYFYKIFYSSYLRSGISFVTLNNPFAELKSTHDFPCANNIMKDFIKNNSEPIFHNNPASGITICCDIKDLKNIVTDIPDMKLFEKEILSFDEREIDILFHELQQQRP